MDRFCSCFSSFLRRSSLSFKSSMRSSVDFMLAAMGCAVSPLSLFSINSLRIRFCLTISSLRLISMWCSIVSISFVLWAFISSRKGTRAMRKRDCSIWSRSGSPFPSGICTSLVEGIRSRKIVGCRTARVPDISVWTTNMRRCITLPRPSLTAAEYTSSREGSLL